TGPDRIARKQRNDRDRSCRSLGDGGDIARNKNIDLVSHQLGSQRRHAVKAGVRPALFDRDIAAFDKSHLSQAFAESGDTIGEPFRRARRKVPDHRHRRLLRPRRERPRRRAAEQRDELAASHLHSMTSSARASSVGGMSMPIALAALRLMTSSYFV